MKAKVYISNIYWNKGLASFCFREQAYERLEDFVRRSDMSGEEVLNLLDEVTEDMDLDDVEEMFYNDYVEDIAEEFGIKLKGCGYEIDDDDE